MLLTAGARGRRPCDPRIYRFPASPVQGLRYATTSEANAARLRRVRPRNRRSGRIPALPYPPSGLDQFTPTGVEVDRKLVAETSAGRLKRIGS